VLAACAAPGVPSASPTPTPTVAPTVGAGWVDHVVPEAGIVVALPVGWRAIDGAELDDPATRTSLEADYAGAPGLFRAVAAQGSRVRIAFLGVDPSTRGRPELAPVVAIVAVEPAVPSIGLGLAADFVLDALDRALAIESEIERSSEDLAVGDAVRFSFEHRVVDDDGGGGRRAALDGALVTTGSTSFLVLRNVDAAQPADAPPLHAILAGIRSRP
jgi:hypothetical protein